MYVEGFVKTDDVNLHYLEWEGESTPLLLLAGLGSTAHIFRSLGSRLAHRHRVIALTRRGHGQSDRPESGYRLERLAADIADFLDMLAVDGVVLVGHSFGGIEIPFFADQYPDRVDSLVFLDGIYHSAVTPPDTSEDPIWSVTADYPSADQVDSIDTFLQQYKRYRPDLARIWCDAIEADVMEYLSIGDEGKVADSRDNDLFAQLLKEAMANLPDYDLGDVPVLAIVPDGDYHPSVPSDAEEELKRRADHFWRQVMRPWIRARTAAFKEAAPQAVIAEFDSSNHHIFVDLEDETVAAIRHFLDR